MLTTSLAGFTLRNPVMLAAGTSGTLDEIADVLDLSRVGALVTKSITRLPREGNPTERILGVRGGAGMLNAIGLANPGIESFEQNYLPRAAAMPTEVIASVAGFSVEDYVVVCAALNEWAKQARPNPASADPRPSAPGPRPLLSAIELNVSCPNVKSGCDFVSTPAALTELLAEVRKVVTRCPLIVKLSPFPRDILPVAKAAIDAGAGALTISNTIPAMAIDVHTRRPRLANVSGGLSGPGLHPVAVRLVHEVYTKLAKDARIPLIGAGGVMTWEDAAEFILAGATAIQIGTALFADPRTPIKVAKGLEKWGRRQRCPNISELVGAIQLA